MNPTAILERYIDPSSDLYKIVYKHSRSVADKALSINVDHPELGADPVFLEEAAMLHDLGVFLTNAPQIYCFGTYFYICHGYLGREILEKEGYPKHALVCERHIGTGLTLEEIIEKKMPLPHRDMSPVSIEEQIICFSDLFFSKSQPEGEKSVESVRRSLEKYGEKGLARFDNWCKMFL
jgi:uncharacterized protein